MSSVGGWVTDYLDRSTISVFELYDSVFAATTLAVIVT